MREAAVMMMMIDEHATRTWQKGQMAKAEQAGEQRVFRIARDGDCAAAPWETGHHVSVEPGDGRLQGLKGFLGTPGIRRPTPKRQGMCFHVGQGDLSPLFSVANDETANAERPTHLRQRAINTRSAQIPTNLRLEFFGLAPLQVSFEPTHTT